MSYYLKLKFKFCDIVYAEIFFCFLTNLDRREFFHKPRASQVTVTIQIQNNQILVMNKADS